MPLPDPYTHFASLYDQMVKHTPNWQAWLNSVLPHLQGPRILDVSCGTGFLLAQIAGKYETYGLDLNAEMIAHARQNTPPTTRLQRADAHHLPYRDDTFDSILNTMAFNGYPDSLRALSEMHRALRQGGRLLIVDVNLPADRSPVGTAFARRWETRLDPDLDMGNLFDQTGFTWEDHNIGGFGSVHLYIAVKTK